MMLYSTDRHFELKSIPWNPDQALEFAHNIMRTIDDTYTETSLWPSHVLDRENEPMPLPTMYLGVEGVAWGLHHWSQLTGTSLKTHPGKILEASIPRHPRFTDVSYFFGRTGIRLAIQSVTPSENNLKLLHEDLALLQKSVTNEIMAGAPGALIAAQLLWEKDKSEENQNLVRQLIDQVLEGWKKDEASQVYLWQQNYGGPQMTFVGAAHGNVGNIFALLRAAPHLTPYEVTKVQGRAIAFLKHAALESDSEANWPPTLPAGEKLMVHWCHGAPGILMQLATLLQADPVLDPLMIKAGNLIWNAGGLKKGASLCHGTAGCGAALLKLFERTGDQLWLDRARTFAMNAIAQIKEDQTTYKQLRYSLWTGDVGAALFLHACQSGKFKSPMLDVI